MCEQAGPPLAARLLLHLGPPHTLRSAASITDFAAICTLKLQCQ
jgi:hypothetical protein